LKAQNASDEKPQPVTLNIAEDYANQPKHDYEEIKASEVQNEMAKSEFQMNQRIAEFEDVVNDSHYPLMTTDPAIRKEYLVKVNDKHLNNVFSSQIDGNVNLQSVILDNYIPTKKVNKKQ
jgi:hypothetical protein